MTTSPVYVQLPLFPTGKVCTKCGVLKRLEDFPVRQAKRDGRDSHCRRCRCESAKRRQEQLAGQLAAHPEQRRALRQKRCGHCGIIRPAGMFVRSPRTWDGLTSDCKVCRAAYRATHPEQRRLYDARSYLKHGDKKRLRRRQWGKADPNRERTRVAQYRARLVQAEGVFCAADIEHAYEAQSGLCYYCGSTLSGVYHVDHKTPLSRGGSNWPANLCCACSLCNTRKHNKTEAEFRALLAAMATHG